MADSGGAAALEDGAAPASRPQLAEKAGPASRPPLAEKALAEAFCRVRYRDTSLLVWQQQQQRAAAPPSSYLSRSQSSWYSSYGNQAVLVRDKSSLEDAGQSRICSVM